MLTAKDSEPPTVLARWSRLQGDCVTVTPMKFRLESDSKKIIGKLLHMKLFAWLPRDKNGRSMLTYAPSAVGQPNFPAVSPGSPFPAQGGNRISYARPWRTIHTPRGNWIIM